MARTANSAVYEAVAARYVAKHPKGGAPSVAFKTDVAKELGVSAKTVGRVVDLVREYLNGKDLLDTRGGDKHKDRLKRPIVAGIAAQLGRDVLAEMAAEDSAATKAKR